MKIYQFPEIYQDWIEKRLGSLHYTLRQPQKLAAAILKASDLYQQDDSLSPWQDADFRAAYYCYFFPLNYVRSLKVIDEAKQLGFFHAQQKYVDYGCGPGTLSAALRDQEIPMKSLVGTDHDLSLKTDYLALSHGSFDPRGKTIPLKGKTLLASYVLNELKEPPAFWLQADSIFLIEPATHQAFKKLLAFRDQLFLQYETGLCKTIDPWGGSYFIETLTQEIASQARKHIQEIDEVGGMAKAIEQGLPKLKIEEAAARTQARIDSGRQPLVGVNMFVPENEPPLSVLKVDNEQVRKEQLQNLERLKRERSAEDVEKSLQALTDAASSGDNLLAACVEAARVHATVGEMSAALEKVFGRHQARIQSLSGVYQSEMPSDLPSFQKAKQMVRSFEKKHGRPPRILLAKMGQDGHDRGQKVVATAFSDLGFDVDIGPLFQTPEESAKQAVENDVHMVGVSSLAAGHLKLVPELKKALAKDKRDDILIIVGGVIPPDDYEPLKKLGAAAVFGPGTVISEAVIELLELIS